MTDPQDNPLLPVLKRIARALELQAGTAEPVPPQWAEAGAFVWQAKEAHLKPVPTVNAVPLGLLVGIDDHADRLLDNTKRFAQGLPANNALLWGARGMGKSSLVKAVHSAMADGALKLVEIHREDIGSLPVLLDLLRQAIDYRFILFCDDLSFDHDDTSYKSLKAALEGGVEGRPANVIFYATSNRRHLMPRDMIDNEQSTAIQRGEAVEEKISLSDRFGLWLGFYPSTQDQYLAMIDRYAGAMKLAMDRENLHRRALEWAMARGNRSGRVAWQFMQDVAE
jgi:predicted AAA+ superfamily ATPase